MLVVILTSSISLTVALQGAVAPVCAHSSCAGFPPAAEQGLWGCCHGALCKPRLCKCTRGMGGCVSCSSLAVAERGQNVLVEAILDDPYLAGKSS